MIQEAGQIESLFAPALSDPSLVSNHSLNEDGPPKAISALAEVVKCDSEIITLELINFIKKYPDVSQDQLACVLTLRGDIKRSEALERAKDLLSSSSKNENSTKTIFSGIQVSSSIFS